MSSTDGTSRVPDPPRRKSLGLQVISATEVDPVCGMTVEIASSAGTASHAGTTYHFCCPRCREKFQADPERYLNKPAFTRMDDAAPGAAAAQYTCPMHPDVVQTGPGTCPLCGMALEPMTFDPHAAENDPELRQMTGRLVVAAICTVPIFALAMLPMISGAALPGSLARIAPWIELILATPVVWWCGLPFFTRAAQALRRGAANMFTLIAIGTGAAWIFSVVAVLSPGLFPTGFHDHGGVPIYFEAAAVITTLVLVGQVLELRARQQTGSAIRALVGLAPQTARRLEPDGSERDVPLEAVRVGDKLRVRPGERLPVDGEVIEGSSAVDESAITGEPNPAMKKPGDPATGGTMNTRGSFVMQATRVGRDTLLARIVALVGEAQRSRAPVQKLADRVAAWFVPAVVLVAILTFILWSAFGPSPAFAYAFVNAVAVLIIACPCALGLATPMSIVVGIGRGAREGILFKNAEALQTLGKVDTVIVDKTGTLTEGTPKLISIEPAPGIAAEDLLRWAAAAERGSEHPLAAAILKGAEDRGQRSEDRGQRTEDRGQRTEDRGQKTEDRRQRSEEDREPVSVLCPLISGREAVSDSGREAVSDFEAVAGQGVRARVNGRSVVIGNRLLMASAGVAVEEFAARAEALEADGQTVVFAAIDGQLAGVLGIADPIKPTTPEAVAQLHADGLAIVILTGDNRATAESVARQLGIDRVEAEVLPEQKGEVVRRFQTEGRIVAMAGDGINDAPALARANVGIAMGAGADVALESSGITLVKGDLRGIAKARRLSRAALRNIRQNLVFAFAYNAIGVPVAAGVLYPSFGILLNPMIAAAAMSLSSVSVIANALRLRRARLDFSES